MLAVRALLVAASLSCAADFPLAGKAFFVFEGGNRNSFGLLEDVSPKKAFFVRFNSSDNATIRWANLDGKYFNNTLDIATEIQRQFSSNKWTNAGRGSLVNDLNVAWSWEENLTLNAKWSCKDALMRMNKVAGDNYYESYTMTGRVTGVEKSVSGSVGALSSEQTVFDDRPECWLQRKKESALYWYYLENPALKANGLEGNSACSQGWCGLRGEVSYRRANFKMLNAEVYDSLECRRLPEACTSRLYYDDQEAIHFNPPSGLYIVHLFPQVVWRPRNVMSGGLHYGVDPVSTAAMRAERKAALDPNATDDPITAGWRSPLVDEALSTTTSFQFRIDEILSTNDVQLRDPSTKPKWTHNPSLAVYYAGQGDDFSTGTIAKALVVAFSYGKTRYQFMRNIDANCGADWSTVEKTVATTMYGTSPVMESRVNELIPYCYASQLDEANALFDGREKLRKARDSRPCVLFSDAKPATNLVKRWKLKTDPRTGKGYDVSDFIWKGCPDGATAFWTSELHIVFGGGAPPAGGVSIGGNKYLVPTMLNRNQLMDALAQPYERCNPVIVANACRAYDWTYNYAVANPSVDWSGEIRDFADRRRRTACPDVSILKAQLASIANPKLRPRASDCQADPFSWSVVTYPTAWTPTVPMEAP